MTGKTHIIGGVAAGAAFVHFFQGDPAAAVSAAALGALIPDICHGGSKIGRKMPLLSKAVNTIFGHRTFTHSLLFLILANMLFTFLISNADIRAGLLAGMASHLLLDACTKNGIKLFYPLSLTVRLPMTMKTGGAGEQLILLLLSLLTIYFGKDLVVAYL
ncbi:metal-dependent hydrolase [Bacillus lacus]|uniref:Metal-dependent hydrolase n=1 Tax=Metabacillus lacus TaxID=1983721 RepID=A0A7X2J1U6_9BACI|nr:metal-dependent hydrolase [Metabacillus lacus]MRX73724.1 metal-dependent hydrolase [Metabacillus lacus]